MRSNSRYARSRRPAPVTTGSVTITSSETADAVTSTPTELGRWSTQTLKKPTSAHTVRSSARTASVVASALRQHLAAGVHAFDPAAVHRLYLEQPAGEDHLVASVRDTAEQGQKQAGGGVVTALRG